MLRKHLLSLFGNFIFVKHKNYVNPSIPKDKIFWMMNLKNITLWITLKNQSFRQDHPQEISFEISLTPRNFVWNIRAHVMLCFENPTHVPLTRFTQGKSAIFTNMDPLGAFWCPFLFGKPTNDRFSDKERVAIVSEWSGYNRSAGRPAAGPVIRT